MGRVAALATKQTQPGEKQALVSQFPSEWLPDQKRGITDRDLGWHASLEGLPERACDFFEKKRAPRGTRLEVEMVDLPGGMPGNADSMLT